MLPYTLQTKHSNVVLHFKSYTIPRHYNVQKRIFPLILAHWGVKQPYRAKVHRPEFI